MKKLIKTNPYVITLCFGFGIIAHMFVGNPVSKIIAGFTFNRYIEENYPGCYYEDYAYDFTCNGYTAVVYSHTNPDIRIVMHTDTLGFTVTRDNYEEAVLLGENTARRLSREYTDIISSILGDEICGHKVYNISAFFADNRVTGEQYSLKSGPLVPGAEYDIYEISPTDGDIILRVIAPGATDETAEEILLISKQKLEDNGIIFDTISLSIGEDADCWPYIIVIENMPYTAFSEDEVSAEMEKMILYNDAEWFAALSNVTDRYIDMVQSAGWNEAQKFRYRGVQIGFYLTLEAAKYAYGGAPLVDDKGLELTDIDKENYQSYTDEYICYLAEKAGHISFNVHASDGDCQTAAEVMNEINDILKKDNIRYAVAELGITNHNYTEQHYYTDIPYTEDNLSAEDIQKYYQQ